MHYIGFDVRKKTISYCVKDASGRIHAESAIPAITALTWALEIGDVARFSSIKKVISYLHWSWS